MTIGLAISLAAPPLARAQQPGTSPPPFKPEELEQIVAPIALYPDPLVAQIFMASTYPLEVVQAARFAKANPNLKDAALNEELKKQDWDDSVKALVSFPQVLEMMDSQIEWTQKLGDAVLAQQKETMDAIQRLRAKAQGSGNLKSTEQQQVIVEPAAASQPQIIRIEPTNPEVVYVPTYNPGVVYGAWPYPAYPPYAYYPPYYPAGYFATAAISFGIGMAVGGAIWGNCNWGGGDINVNRQNFNNFNRNVNRGDRVNPLGDRGGAGGRGGDRGSWQHNPEHRKGGYRDSATGQKFNRGGDSGRAASRESFRGRAEAGRQDLARGGGGQGAGRGGGLGQGGTGAGRGQGGVGSGAGGQRGGGGIGQSGAGGGGGRAFQGAGGQGQSQRSYSQRGQASRGAGGSSFSSAGGRGGSGGFSGGGGGRGGGGGGGRGGGRR